MARFLLVCLFLLQFGLAEVRNFEQANIFFDGTKIKFQTAVMSSDEAVYVPLRELAQSMGLELTYDTRQDAYTIKRAADSRVIILRAGSRRFTVNGKTDELNQPAMLLKNSFYVPLNDFLWAFGYFVERDSQNNYYIVTRLNTVAWDKQTLTLHGDAPLRVQLSAVPEGYQLLLRHTILGVYHASRINPADGVLDSIEYTQVSLNPGLVKILIRTKAQPPYTVLQEDAINSYKMRFNYQLHPELLKPEIAIRAEPEKIVSTVSSTGFPGINALWLPENFLSNRKKIDIIIRGNTVNVGLKSKADILYVDFDSVFGQLGCTLTKANGAYILTDNRGRIYRLENGLVYGPEFQEKYTLLKDGQDYFPLVQTLKIIGYAAYYTMEKIYINPRIYELSYADRNNQRRVIIRANDKLLPGNIQYLDNPPRALLDIPNSSYDVSLNILRLNDRNVKTVRAAQFNKGVVRIVADLPDLKNKPVLSFEEDGRALVLLFDTAKLTGIAVAADKDNNLSLKFLADNVLLNNYTVQKLDNPARLIVDFSGVALDLANETQVRQGPVERVRSSQLSWDPLQARIVLDLNDTYRQYTRGTDGSLVLLTAQKSTSVFNPVTEIKTITVPAKAPETPAVTNILKGLRVAVIVGHGGNDPGAISRSGYMEKNLTLELAKKLQTLLREKGAIALLSREGDENISLDGQAEFAIRNKADVLVSLHLNNFVNESTNGTESFYYKPVDYELARCVHEEIIKQTGLHNRGLRKAQMHNLNHTNMPGVLLEPLFLSNRKEEKLIETQDFQWKLMRAVVAGIENYQKNKEKK